MKNTAQRRLYFVALLGASVLAVRVAGIHTHLCFDGQEAPSEVHLVDAGIHTSHDDSGQDHQDIDVQVSDVLAKNVKSNPESIPGLVTGDAPSVRIVGGSPVLRTFGTATLRLAVDFLRPPLRGPPVRSSL